MIAQPITIAGEQMWLCAAQPNWASEVTVTLELPTDVAKQDITYTEARRTFAESARYTLDWHSYMSNSADATELRIFLTRLREQTVAVPMWPDQCELLNAISAGATSITLYDDPVRYGTYWIFASSDFSIREVVTVTSYDPVANVLTISPGTVNSWAAGTQVYPLVFGYFPDRPKPESITDETYEVNLVLKEASVYARNLSTPSGSIPTVGANISAFSTLPLWNTAPNFVKPLDWTEKPDILYEPVGFLRTDQIRTYGGGSHRNARGLELEFYQADRGSITAIERLWRDRRGNVRRFMIPSYRGDMRLLLDTPAPTSTQIACEPNEYGDPGRETQPGDPYIALIDQNNAVDPYQISAVTAVSPQTPTSPDTLSGLVGWWKADSLALADGAAVSTWTDSSSAANNATQATGANQPIFKVNIINGKPVVRFNGTTTRMTLASEMTLSDLTIFVVFQTNGSSEVFLASASAVNDQPFATLSNQIGFYDHIDAQFLSNTLVNPRTVWSYGTMTRAGTAISYFERGVPRGSGTQSFSVKFGLIGCASPLANFVNGDIAEIVVYNRSLSASDRINVGTYLAYKYNLPAPPAVSEMDLTATVTVAAHPHLTTILSNLYLARFFDPKLEWHYLTPYVATTKIKFRELPHEYASTPAEYPEPAYLFVFNEVGVRTDLFTSYENQIVVPSGTYAGTYVPAPFSFSAIKTSLKMDQETLDLKSFPFTGNPLNKMWPFALDGILTLTVVETDYLNPASTTVRFYGDVWSVDSQYKCKCIAFGNFFERNYPRFLIGVSDNYVQFSPPTMLNPANFLVTGTIVSMSSQSVVINSATGFGEPASWFAGGWLDTGIGTGVEHRGILDSSPGTSPNLNLTLDRPLIKAIVGQAVNMYPGYDGSITQCTSKFSNQPNFGGHPYIPNINPAVKAMKNKTVPGGKKL